MSSSAPKVEEQTRKLFEVCRLRDVPIITFVYKRTARARGPFDLPDEIEQSLVRFKASLIMISTEYFRNMV